MTIASCYYKCAKAALILSGVVQKVPGKKKIAKVVNFAILVGEIIPARVDISFAESNL